MKADLLATIVLPLAVSAHFGLNYPTWRADSLAETNESISQWSYPCANVQPMQNTSLQRTPWPLEGGSVSLDLNHHWTYLFVNLGFGAEVTNFNISLNPNGGQLINQTGNGTFCWNQLRVPSSELLGLTITEGQEASIQVVTVGDSGSALYNCADIVFTSNATLLAADQCVNSTGVTAQSVELSSASNATGSSHGDHSGTASGSAASSTSSGAASSLTVSSFMGLLAAGVLVL
ncbi:hypothetical protein LTS08_002444 [Lithohypha guttulata]|uniref:uncharacterized protein n=1 Tax=Lithohypha guttulata TaxID=1690604 RepID=UPI002DDFD1A6|nr:hypothetical protein LTS08_002444 [Lithohypha guttulata]